MRLTMSRLSPGLGVLACILAISLTGRGTSAAYGATDSVPQIELQCKIGSAKVSRPSSVWLFQLRKATGELAHVQVAVDGQTVKVKNLSPAIYIGCLAGQAGRESCVSMDLQLPEDKKSVRIKKELQVPQVSALAPDEYVVGTARLAVPEAAYAEMLAAQRAEILGEHEQAQVHLRSALEIYPDYPQALNNLGTYYYRSGRFNESLELLTKATMLEPDFYAAWVNLAGSLIAVARFDAALSAVLKALKLRPNDALANSRAGLAYFYKRDYVEARTYFRKSLNLDPAAASVPQLFLAHIALGQGHPEEAEKYLREYLDVHPNAPNAAQLRVTLHRIEAGAFNGLTAVLPDR